MKNSMKLIIAHTKGGVGKSTIAWNLAHAFSRTHKVRIVDCDFNKILYYINRIGGNPFEVIQPKTIDELLAVFASQSEDEILIVDVGGFDSGINRKAIEYADKVLIPISTDSINEVLGFKTFKAILAEIGSKAELNVVLNEVHIFARNFSAIHKAVSGMDIKILNTVIRDRKLYKTTMANGQSVLGTSAEDEIMAVCNELR